MKDEFLMKKSSELWGALLRADWWMYQHESCNVIDMSCQIRPLRSASQCPLKCTEKNALRLLDGNCQHEKTWEIPFFASFIKLTYECKILSVKSFCPINISSNLYSLMNRWAIISKQWAKESIPHFLEQQQWLRLDWKMLPAAPCTCLMMMMVVG